MRVIYDKNIITVEKSTILEKYPAFLNPKMNLNTNLNSKSKKNTREITINIQSLVDQVDWVYNKRSGLSSHLNGQKLIPLIHGGSRNFDKLVLLLNLARFNLKFGSNEIVQQILKKIKNYFQETSPSLSKSQKTNSNSNSNPNSKELLKGTRLRGALLKDIQVLWLFPEFMNDDSSESEKTQEDTSLDCCFRDLAATIYESVVKHNRNTPNRCTFMKHILCAINYSKKLQQMVTSEMLVKIMEKILEEQVKANPDSNYLCDVHYLDLIHQQPSILKTFPLQSELGFVDSDQQITFNLRTLQKRIITYSGNILNPSFPFDDSAFIIAGGFPTNVICGLKSIYTDLDFYIYKDFNETCQKIIDHLSKTYTVELTSNSCIINVILVGSKMNLQLINTKEVGQEVINKFDLSYSQAMISSWDKIEITLAAYKAYLTGQFEINSSVRINPSRILKAYVKGFQINDHSIRKASGTKIDDDAKEILNELKGLKDQDISRVLKKHLLKGSTNHEILTKAVYLKPNIYEKLGKHNSNIQEHLEKITKFKYLKQKDIPTQTFKPLEIYGSKYHGYGYESGDNSHTLDKVITFVKDDKNWNKTLPIEYFDLKARYATKPYSNETEDCKYTFSTVISPKALYQNNNSFLALYVSHPLIKHIKEIEEKIQKDFADELGPKCQFRSRLSYPYNPNQNTDPNYKPVTVNIGIKTSSFYEIGKERFEVKKRDQCDFCTTTPNESYFKDFIEAHPDSDRIQINLSLRNLWTDRSGYSYAIQLSPKVYCVKSKEESIFDEDDEDEEPMPKKILRKKRAFKKILGKTLEPISEESEDSEDSEDSES